MMTHQSTQTTSNRWLGGLALVTSAAIEAIYGRGNSLRMRLLTLWNGMLNSADMLAGENVLRMEGDAPAEGDASAEGEKQGLTILGLSGMSLAVVGCLVLLVCVLPVCGLLLLLLLGPTIGNVFSEVNAGI